MSWYAIANASEIASPTLLIYPDRVEENLKRMIRFAGDPSRLRPHVKTHKLPQIIAMKRQLGIDKFKTSTIAEAEMTAEAGGRDVLLAYQPVGPNAQRFARLITAFPETQFSTLVDNPTTLAELSSVAISAGVEMTVLVDLNVGMNRTGIAPGAAAVSLYESLHHRRGIIAGGLHAYDGHLHDPDRSLRALGAEEVWRKVNAMVEELRARGIDVPRIVAGGTPTSPLLIRHDHIEVGAGTTVLWDFGQSETTPDLDFLNAAVLLARVVSCPAEGRICLDLGHKAVASEMPQPRVRWFTLEDAEIETHSEEHMVLRTDRAAEYPVGTVVYGIPRHVCPTVALQSEVWCVRDSVATQRWPVVARTRCITI